MSQEQMNRRDGERASRGQTESANRRVGETARSPFRPFPVSPCRRNSLTTGILDQPLLRLIDHFDELPENAFVGIVDFAKLSVGDVAVTRSEFDVHLRLGSFRFGVAEFGNESCFITAFTPGFRDVR